MRLPTRSALHEPVPLRAAPLAALLLSAAIALSPSLARAQSVTVRIDTPQIGIRLGQPLPRYAPPVIHVPAPVPPVVYLPAAVPRPLVVPVYPPVIYAAPRVIYAPVVLPPGRRWGHHDHRWRHDERDGRHAYRGDSRVIYAPY